MNHAELVERAGRWLRGARRCPVVCTELATFGTNECADAIGWGNGVSTLVECKATRSDFLADRKKSFRRMPDTGMGCFRYFLTPPGLLSPDELPNGWGLAEAHGRQTRIVVKAERIEPNHRAEKALLASIIRRMSGEFRIDHITQSHITIAPLDEATEAVA